MEREDEDEGNTGISPESSKQSLDKKSGPCEETEQKISAKNGEDKPSSGSSAEAGKSRTRLYLEDNKFVIESPSGTGDFDEAKIAGKVSDEDEEMPESSEALRNVKSSTSKESESTSQSLAKDCGKSKRGISGGQEVGCGRVPMEESNKSSSDTESSKRQKTEETGNGTVQAVDKDEDGPLKFVKLKSKVRKRNYRVKQDLQDENADNEDLPIPGTSNGQENEIEGLSDRNSSSPDNEDLNLEVEAIADIEIAQDDEEESGDSSEDDMEDEDRDDEDSNSRTSVSEDDDSEDRVPPVLQKEMPKPQWFIVPEVINRQLGSNRLFQRRFYGSLHTVQRLELMYKLKEHKGCVNTLSFNQRGNLLASGSDDLMVVIWDWPLGKKHHSFKTGHRSNVFQASWLPLPSENLMVTCARDGHVRLADLHKSSSDCTRRLASHEGPATKLSIHPDVPHVILSVGEDAKVFAIDIRQSKPSTLVTVKEGLSQVAIYSINSNPLNSNEFCLGGRDQFVRVYDKRKVSSPLYKLCPENLKNNKNHARVTCAMYNYNGSEIVASYNDEDIYLFDTLLPFPIGEFAHKYQGHRNNATVKGVNFFGPKSEFVISGSDCGNIYIWEKNTEAIVKWMAGDEFGVVNRLEPHPHIPVLATSGLDYDVKIWVPSCEEPPSMKDLETCVRYNMKRRARDMSREPDAFDGQLLRLLWRHATRREESRSRRGLGRGSGDARGGEEVDTSSDDTSIPSNSPSEDESDGRPQCSPS